MRMIDPTYLRIINDGLYSGILHKDNASALPMGLVGMYEGALPPASNVNERKKFLDFFAVWALLKKEVSVTFLMALLEGWSEETIIYYINKYSKWFNSPISGKYVLYHERLRAFILQKISKNHFNACNETIIKVSHDALSRRSGDEWENYALEYLSNHMLIPALEKGDGSVLKLLAYNTTHWNRQVEISKGFEWSKRMLNDMMLWASKYDDEEVIECALNKVDLYHQEQNDAPRIVELVAQNDIETALDRIESFGGSNSEGLRYKFTLYMICLAELTLLESKDQPFRKSAIEALLKHLVEYLPRDHSILQWNEFFPSYLMFQMACVWAELGLDYLNVYQRTDDWENEWILERGPYTHLQIGVLVGCAHGISDDHDKSRALKVIALALSKQGEVQKALAIARSINHEGIKCCALTDIAISQSEQGLLKESASLMQESLTIASGMNDYEWQGSALKEISLALSNQGRVEESLAIARDISDEFQKCIALSDISVALNKYGNSEESASVIQESLAIARGTWKSNDYWQESALTKIAITLCKQGLVDDSLAIALEICDYSEQRNALQAIAVELCKQGQVEEALSIARGISDESDKSSALKDIAVSLSEQGKVEESESVMQESLSIARGIVHYKRSSALNDIALALSKIGQFEESLAIAHSMSNYDWQDVLMKDIAAEMIKRGLLEKSVMVLQETLIISRGIGDEISYMSGIALELRNLGLVKESLALIRCISDSSQRNVALRNSSLALSRQGKVEESLAIAREMNDEFQKSLALNGIAVELSKQGQVEEAASVTQESLAHANRISSAERRSIALIRIAEALSEQGHLQKALDLALSFGNKEERSSALKEISQVLIKQGQLEESLSIARGISDFVERSRALEAIASALCEGGEVLEALSVAREIRSDFCKSSALSVITVELIKQGKVEESLAIARGMGDDFWQECALSNIALALSKQGKFEESLAIARGISFYGKQSSALKYIAVELSKQGDWLLAEKIGLEIPQIGERHECWKTIAAETVKFSNWEAALESVKFLKSEEAQLYYLKGWASEVNKLDAKDDCVNLALPILSKDPESIETLLQKYAVREVVLGKPSRELTDRFNRTLNIQWAIDIKNSISASKS